MQSLSEETLKKRINITDPAKITSHDPLADIKQQQDALNIAIAQHEGDPEIQDALRKQKDALGDAAAEYKHEKEAIKAHGDDGGGTRLSAMHHVGTIGDTLLEQADKVTKKTHKINEEK